MNPRFSRSALSIFIASAGLMLAACGGGSSSGSSTDNADDSGDHTHEEHEHSGRVLFSESGSTTLQVFDQAEEILETLDGSAAANGPSLVLADNGLSAAVVNASVVQFVNAGLHEEEHEEEEGAEEEHDEEEHGHEEASLIDFTLSGSSVGPVITSRGHFSVLVDGATHIVPTEDIESLTSEDVESITIPYSQSYPAAVLDEATETMLIFYNLDSTSYSAITVDGNEPVAVEECSSPYLAAESEHITLFGCGSDALYFISQEGDFDEIQSVTLPDGVSAWPTQWITNGDNIAGYSAGQIMSLSTEEDDVTETVTVTATDVTAVISQQFTPGNFCTAAFATEESDYAAVASDDGFLYVIDTETDSASRIQLEESNPASLACGDLFIAPAAEGFMVVDNAAHQLYVVDKHEDASNFHIHSIVDLSSDVSDVQDMVFMHAIEGGEHDHEH